MLQSMGVFREICSGSRRPVKETEEGRPVSEDVELRRTGLNDMPSTVIEYEAPRASLLMDSVKSVMSDVLSRTEADNWSAMTDEIVDDLYFCSSVVGLRSHVFRADTSGDVGNEAGFSEIAGSGSPRGATGRHDTTRTKKTNIRQGLILIT